MQKIKKENIPIQQNMKRITLILIGLFSVLLLLRDLGGTGVPRIMFIAISIAVCIIGKKSDIFCLMAFLAPVAEGTPYKYIAVIALVILLLKQKMRVHVKGLFLMISILLIELLSAFRGSFSFADYFRFTGVFFITFLRMIDTDDQYDNLGMVKMYLFGYIVAMVDIFGQMQRQYSWADFLKMKVRFGNTRQLLGSDTEGMLLSYNPNTLGTICILAAMFCLLLYHKEKRPRYPVLFVLASLIGITTQSRTFLIVYILAIVLYICLSCRSFSTAIKSLFGFAIGGTFIYILANRLLSNYIQSFSERLATDDISGGRIEIMQYYFSKMFQHIDRLIIGVGLQNYQAKYGYNMSAHNATQEVLITWGIIGLIIVIVLFVIIIQNAKRLCPKALLIQYIPIFALLVATQAGQGFSKMPNMFYFMVTYSAIMLQLEKQDSTS